MWTNCPSEYLTAELAELRPRAIIVLGAGEAADRLRAAATTTDWEQLAKLERGAVEVGGAPVPVYCCFHPSNWGWRASHRALCAALAGTTA